MPSRKTRVLLLGPLLGSVSGVATHLNHLMQSRLSEEISFTHFVVGSEGRQENAVNQLLRLLCSPILLAVWILKEDIDIVHINVSLDHKSFPRDAVYLAVARALGRVVVFQVHGGAPPQQLYRSRMISELFVRRTFEAPNVVVLLSKAELNAYRSFVPKGRFRVIAHGIEVDHDEPLLRKATTAPLRWCYVGRLVESKGVAVCIEAARLLSAAGREFRFVIAGAGPQELALKAMAAPMVERGFIEFVGPQFGAAKEKLWQESDVFVFPTQHAEGLPYSLLEAMRAGVVPITTRVGAQPDVAVQGVHGLFIPPADPQALRDAVATLDGDRDLLLEMSRNCINRIRCQFSIDRFAGEFRETYESLMT